MKEPVRRGAVIAARLGPVEGSEQGGTRPVVVVSNELFNEVMPIVTVVPVSSRRRDRRIYPSEVLLQGGTAGLRVDSVVLCHQIRTIASVRLGRRIGQLEEPALQRVDRSLRLHLGLADA